MQKISVIKKIYRNILRILPKKIALYVIYFRGYKKLLNLKKPRYWGEKIQWLKLNGKLEEVTPFVDKYEVRSYIEDKIGNNYLNELYGVYNSVEEIEIEKLPNKFVLKNTNGSGAIIICKDKANFDLEQAQRIMKKWLKDNYYKEKKEPQYKNIKNRIIIEKYLEDNTGSLTDYKFYCFDGKVQYYGIFYDRFSDETADFYNNKGEKLYNVKTGGVKNSNKIEKFDERIKEMIKLSEKLSAKFTHVRVDFYYVNSKIVFGELTFTDGAGSDMWTPIKFDLEIADKMKLEKVYKKG